MTSHPPISPKSQFYRTDGNGRDFYICHNNGGLCASNLPKPELVVSSFRPRRQVSISTTCASLKTVRYASNGTGRDAYIVQGCGGFETTTAALCPKAVFYRSLRVDLTRPQTSDSAFHRVWLPMASRQKVRLLAKQQRRLTLRLTTPKNERRS